MKARIAIDIVVDLDIEDRSDRDTIYNSVDVKASEIMDKLTKVDISYNKEYAWVAEGYDGEDCEKAEISYVDENNEPI